jgi:hypothetical protein
VHRLWQAQYSLKYGQSPVSLGEGRGLNKSPPAVLVQCIVICAGVLGVNCERSV